MTKEDKSSLLRDLCARLPYGVKIKYHYKRENNVIDEVRELDFSDVETLKYNNEYPQDCWCEISWKPYLRQLSSMTEKEMSELRQWGSLCMTPDYCVEDVGVYGAIHSIPVIDWLNAHHFDYRGMIEKGLALPAKEGMY